MKRFGFFTALLLFSICSRDRAEAEPSYEQCTKQNSYFESEWAQPVSPEGGSSISVNCVFQLQNTNALTGKYGYCTSESGGVRRKKGLPRPCLSQKYTQHTHQAIVDVADCLNIPIKPWLLMLGHESHLHVNAVGNNGDTGIGQLTGSGIGGALGLNFEKNTEMIRSSTKGSCKRIAPKLKKVSPKMSQRCALMKAPENPTRNLIYSAMLHKNNIQIFSNKLKSFTALQNIDSEKLTQLLAMLAYNAGAGGASVALRNFVKKNKGVSARDFEFSETTGNSRFNQSFTNNYLQKLFLLAKKHPGCGLKDTFLFGQKETNTEANPPAEESASP